MTKLKIDSDSHADIMFYVSNYYPDYIKKVVVGNTIYMDDNYNINIVKGTIFNDFRYDEVTDIDTFFGCVSSDNDENDIIDYYDLYEEIISEELDVHTRVNDDEFLNEIINYDFIDTMDVIFDNNLFLVISDGKVRLSNFYFANSRELNIEEMSKILELYDENGDYFEDLGYYEVDNIEDISNGVDYNCISFDVDTDNYNGRKSLYLVLDYNSFEGILTDTKPLNAKEISRYTVFDFFGKASKFSSITSKINNSILY